MHLTLPSNQSASSPQSFLRLQISMVGMAFMRWWLLSMMMMTTINIKLCLCNASIDTRALFILGDSTVDVGNNNGLDTPTSFKANYPPYGRRFFGKPTGRFSEGRVIVDFIAEYAGLPYIPPYADREADFSHGANFASGGAGILSETNQGMVINLKTQLAQFVELHKLLSEKMTSTEEAGRFFGEAVYFLSIGSNDYMAGYLANPAMQQTFPPEQYVAMNVGNLTEAISLLYSKGARKVAYLGLGPLGCLPGIRMASPEGCLASGSAIAQAHNEGVSVALKYIQSQLPGLTVVYANFFDFLTKRIEDPTGHGFKEEIKACCGSGRYGGVFNCGEKDLDKDSYEVCSDANEWVWWDSFHPSELIHEQFAQLMWSGSNKDITPLNVQDLFQTYFSSLCSHNEEVLFASALQT